MEQWNNRTMEQWNNLTVQSFKTNIKCGGCISKVKPYLDKIPEIKSWNVDLASPDRILTIDGDVNSELVVKAIASAGYRADKIQ
jgi:copper chaperone